MGWIDIRYRDFHDVPRIFVFRVGNRLFLADCPFDDQLDDYGSSYALFELPADVSLDGSWEALRDHAIRDMGQVSVAEVVFDETKRRRVDSALLEGRL